ncbi:hypothetical protein MED121_12495 [Marinomonas sp. MED121]|uniref:LodA/GoxA family CTQ-dependent oxidase n=1 Tax=Marinomonas sp. MED121 TaxID=314277 RepID=UPI000068FECA|nr:LodA/GoxA family CTQ-dependent oxidase [Marinomonas sp. MED121]EAQ66745.1 hypothetical protein MED121_12495 [Marinomonas sp. MED121]
MSDKLVFRVHPSINFARFGTSDEYILSPETSAGLPQANDNVTGGLPIKKDTESDPVTSNDLRDEEGFLRKQAARFRIYAYENGKSEYPSGEGTEVTIGTVLPDGRKVKTMLWSCHLANKKSAAYNVVNDKGIKAYDDGVPQRRNPEVHGDINDPNRLNQLMIDPGPRVINGRRQSSVGFNASTPAEFVNNKGEVTELPDYPIRFPQDTNEKLFEPSGPLNTLGEMRTDGMGRLLLLASSGNAVGQYDEYDQVIQMNGDLNNAGWFDSAADGPVDVTLVFEDDSIEQVHGAWVVCCDPAYAPQIRNVVSVWDNLYDMFVRKLSLQPDLYDQASDKYNCEYTPSFTQDIKPIFIACNLQRWTANLPPFALNAHTAVDAIDAKDDPNKTIMSGLNFIRNPNKDESNIGAPLMPLSLGEAGTSFLTVTKTQYFNLEQWSKNSFSQDEGSKLGKGELLDIASLSNCLGGRYVPGIEVSYSIMDKEIYIQDWRKSGAGPFRIKHKRMDYQGLNKADPYLNIGWIPRHGMTDGLEPGDLSKFMAIPWQTDYNSCSIHATAINTDGVNMSNGAESTLYWSWPSQRPDAVYVAEEVINNVLPQQKWSVRGPGTYAINPASAATFQNPVQSVTDWDKIGFIIQGTNIDDKYKQYDANLYLEVEGQLTAPGDASDPVAHWPFNANPKKKL